MEATEHGYDEALLLDVDGFVAEGAGENLFIVKDGVIYEPEIASALIGITRATIIALAEELGYKVVSKRLTRDDIYIADEAFFTGTAAEVTPIRELDGRTDRRRPSRPDHHQAAEPVLRRGQRQACRPAPTGSRQV